MLPSRPAPPVQRPRVLSAFVASPSPDAVLLLDVSALSSAAGYAVAAVLVPLLRALAEWRSGSQDPSGASGLAALLSAGLIAHVLSELQVRARLARPQGYALGWLLLFLALAAPSVGAWLAPVQLGAAGLLLWRVPEVWPAVEPEPPDDQPATALFDLRAAVLVALAGCHWYLVHHQHTHGQSLARLSEPIGWWVLAELARPRLTTLRAVLLGGFVLLAGLGALALVAAPWSALGGLRGASIRRLSALAVGAAGLVVTLVLATGPGFRAFRARTGLPLEDGRHRSALVLAAIAVTVLFVAPTLSARSLLEETALRASSWAASDLGTTLIAMIVPIVAVFVLAGAAGGRGPAELAERLGLHRPDPLVFFGLVLAGIAVALAAQPLLEGARALLHLDAPSQEILRLLFHADAPLEMFTMVVLAAISEELWFRGLLQPRLGLYGTTAAFGAMHAYQYGPLALTWVLLLGLLMGVIARRFGTFASMTFHVTFNVAGAALALVFAR